MNQVMGGWVGGKSNINQQNFCMVCLASNDYKSSTKNTYSLSALSQCMNHEIHALITFYNQIKRISRD